jgi:hypothetical protein
MKNHQKSSDLIKPIRFYDYFIKMAGSNLIGFFLISSFAFGQEQTPKPAETGLGNGLNFSLNENQYQFKISGFLQPSWQMSKLDTLKTENTFRSKRSYLNFGGKALKEKLSFFVQIDFSASTPLLDAFATYHFNSKWNLSAGQRRTFTNNREMTFDEDKLQFSERGMLSNSFSGNGREFGLFLEGKLGSKFVIHPQLAITSGDGPNSFGLNSTDIDLGGFKYGGRLDMYPLGEFSEGNRGYAADLKHESKPKILIGGAASFNKGASSAKGEGHGDFRFYDKNKTSNLPDYRKISADILVKFKGFSLLAEFINSSASGLSGTYTDSVPNAPYLKPGQISQYLVLGNAYNVQAGYVTKSGYSLDLRYEKQDPEFPNEPLSVLPKAEVATIGLSKYFPDNRLKIQATVSQIKFVNNVKAIQSELLLQVVF